MGDGHPAKVIQRTIPWQTRITVRIIGKHWLRVTTGTMHLKKFIAMLLVGQKRCLTPFYPVVL